MGRPESHNAAAGGLRRRNSGRRILENRALARGLAQQCGGEEIDFRVGLGPGDLVAIHNHMKMPRKPGFSKDEFDVSRLGVAGHCHWPAGVTLQEPNHPRNQAPLKLRPHSPPVQLLFGGAVLEDLFRRVIAAHQRPDELVISQAVHALRQIRGGLDPKPPQVLAPHFDVYWIGIDNHAVEVEDQRRPAG